MCRDRSGRQPALSWQPTGTTTFSGEGYLTAEMGLTTYHGWDGATFQMTGTMSAIAYGHVYGVGPDGVTSHRVTDQANTSYGGSAERALQATSAGLAWLTGTPTQWCSAQWDAPSPTCRPVTAWDNNWAAWPTGDALYTVRQQGEVWVDNGTSSVRVALPPVNSCVLDETLACLVYDGQRADIWRIGPDGKAVRAVRVPDVQLRVEQLSLTPTAMYGSDNRGTTSAWRRTVAGGAYGAEEPLEGQRTVASGARYLVNTTWFDGAQRGATFTATHGVVKAPGPYAMVARWADQRRSILSLTPPGPPPRPSTPGTSSGLGPRPLQG